jgi:hypothetical protein
MANDASQIKVASNGGIFVARFEDEPTLPTDLTTPLDAAFTNLGYVGDDGVTFNKSEEVEDIKVWQKTTPARRITTSRDFSAAGPLTQWNQDTVATAFGGGEWTEPKSGVFRYDPPDDMDPLAEWVVVVEGQDGDRLDRWVIERANVTGDIETQYVRNAPSLLPVTFSALTPDDKDHPWYYLTNDEAMETGS